eukprot:scaffold22171_cov136-Skeletonema_dohrnii-CCMP3373.AAC.1
MHALRELGAGCGGVWSLHAWRIIRSPMSLKGLRRMPCYYHVQEYYRVCGMLAKKGAFLKISRGKPPICGALSSIEISNKRGAEMPQQKKKNAAATSIVQRDNSSSNNEKNDT